MLISVKLFCSCLFSFLSYTFLPEQVNKYNSLTEKSFAAHKLKNLSSSCGRLASFDFLLKLTLEDQICWVNTTPMVLNILHYC